MALPAKNIQDLQSLDREIYLLRTRAKELEEKIDLSFNYLQEQYSSMTMKSVFPFLLQKAGITGAVVQVLLQNKRFKESLGNLADYLFDKVADGLDSLNEKLSSRKGERV
jgi:hypothetical protein